MSLPDIEDRGPSTVFRRATFRYKNFIWVYGIDIQWTGEFFAKLQAIPAHPSDYGLQPLSNWGNLDAGYLAVVEALKRILGG